MCLFDAEASHGHHAPILGNVTLATRTIECCHRGEAATSSLARTDQDRQLRSAAFERDGQPAIVCDVSTVAAALCAATNTCAELPIKTHPQRPCLDPFWTGILRGWSFCPRYVQGVWLRRILYPRKRHKGTASRRVQRRVPGCQGGVVPAQGRAVSVSMRGRRSRRVGAGLPKRHP